MTKYDPEQLIFSWLDNLPKTCRHTLVRQYIFMTCTVSDDLVLSGDDACQLFRKKLSEPDFPLRRVARLLTVRSSFSFLLDSLSADARGENLENGPDRNLQSIDLLQYLRADQQFKALVEADLSDDVLQAWLQELEN